MRMQLVVLVALIGGGSCSLATAQEGTAARVPVAVRAAGSLDQTVLNPTGLNPTTAPTSAVRLPPSAVVAVGAPGPDPAAAGVCLGAGAAALARRAQGGPAVVCDLDSTTLSVCLTQHQSVLVRQPTNAAVRIDRVVVTGADGRAHVATVLAARSMTLKDERQMALWSTEQEAAPSP